MSENQHPLLGIEVELTVDDELTIPFTVAMLFPDEENNLYAGLVPSMNLDDEAERFTEILIMKVLVDGENLILAEVDEGHWAQAARAMAHAMPQICRDIEELRVQGIGRMDLACYTPN